MSLSKSKCKATYELNTKIAVIHFRNKIQNCYLCSGKSIQIDASLILMKEHFQNYSKITDSIIVNPDNIRKIQLNKAICKIITKDNKAICIEI